MLKKKSLFKVLNRKGHELGRTMLEFLAVVALIGFLMIGGLYTYDKAVTTTQVDRISEDIMVIVSARYNRGTPRTTKGIADVGVKGKTRLGNEVALVEGCPSKGIFTIKIKDIKKKVCAGLYDRLSQNDQFNVSSYYRTNSWSDGCDTINRRYIRSASECGDEGVFVVSFFTNKNANGPEVCKTDADCNYDDGTDNCRYCSSENICEDKSGSGACGDGKACHRGGKCHKDCNSDEYWNGTTCQTCPPHATCDSNVVSCEAGYEWNAPNCTPCSDGTISAEGDNTCSPCDKGQKASSDHVSCENCTNSEDCGCGSNAQPDGDGGCVCNNGHSGENCGCDANVAKDGACDSSCSSPCIGGLVCTGNAGLQSCTCQRGLLAETCYSGCGDNACVDGLICTEGNCRCKSELTQGAVCNSGCPASCASGLKCDGTCKPRTKRDECTTDADCPSASGLKCLGTEGSKKCDCPSDKPNWNGNVCVACICGDNQYCDSNNQCQDCEAKTSCIVAGTDSNGCPITKVNCTGTQYCDSNGSCQDCSSPTQSCTISENVVDETTGCVTTQAITCSGDTPLCAANGKSCVAACGTDSHRSNGHCCPSTSPYWDTKSEFCTDCPSPTESCLIQSDVKDADDNCVERKAITCSGNTPYCTSTGSCVSSCPTGTVPTNNHCCKETTPYWDSENESCIMPDCSSIENSSALGTGEETDIRGCFCEEGYQFNDGVCSLGRCDDTMLELGFTNNDFTYDSLYNTITFKGSFSVPRDMDLDCHFIAENFTNAGHIFKAKSLAVTSSTLDNSGTLLLDGSLLAPSNTINTGEITADFLRVSDGSSFENKNTITLKGQQKGQQSSIEVDSFKNSGTFLLPEGMLYCETFDNSRKFSCSNELCYLEVGTSLNNSGTMNLSNGEITPKGEKGVPDNQKIADIINSGNITVDGIHARSIKQTAGNMTITCSTSSSFCKIGTCNGLAGCENEDTSLSSSISPPEVGISVTGGKIKIEDRIEVYAENIAIRISNGATVNAKEASFISYGDKGIELNNGELTGGDITGIGADFGLYMRNNSHVKLKNRSSFAATGSTGRGIYQNGGEIISCAPFHYVSNGINAQLSGIGKSSGIFSIGGKIQACGGIEGGAEVGCPIYAQNAQITAYDLSGGGLCHNVNSTQSLSDSCLKDCISGTVTFSSDCSSIAWCQE